MQPPERHETPAKDEALAPAGFGVGTIPQVEPSHRSARAEPIPSSRTNDPTAMQETGLEQESQFSSPLGAFGFGVGTIDHPTPADPPAQS